MSGIITMGLGSGFLPGETVFVEIESTPISISSDQTTIFPTTSEVIINLNTTDEGPLVQTIAQAIDIIQEC